MRGEGARSADEGFICLALLFFLATPLLGQTVVRSTDRGVLVAQAGSLQLFDRVAQKVLWTAASVQTPTAIVTSKDHAAVIDALENEVRIYDLTTSKATTIPTGETPVDGLFLNGALYLLERDARALERIGTDGARASIAVAADPAFLRQSNGALYVYSRVDGLLQEVTTTPFAISRSVKVAPFASDFEADSRYAYLVYPRRAAIDAIALETMTASNKIEVGAVPVDLAFASAATALNAKTFAIADPSSKRIWMIEGAQSATQAFARGFLRGLLGLGARVGSSDFPTGIDRVSVRGSRTYAYDSSTGTLYRFEKRRATVIAKSVAPQGFTVANEAVYVWDETVRRLQRIDAE